MSLVHYKPINLFDQFNREINHLMNSTREQSAANDERSWAPAVDIREEDNRYLLIADIPGVKRDDVEITLEDGVLTVKGERNANHEESREGFVRNERVHGIFMRQFTLPDTVNADNISATVNAGVLEIEIPKQDKPEPRKITVS